MDKLRMNETKPQYTMISLREKDERFMKIQLLLDEKTRMLADKQR